MMKTISSKGWGLSESVHWPFLAAASVLTDFSAASLLPLRGKKPEIVKAGEMLMEYGKAITSGPAKGRWSLSNTSRRAALRELKNLNLLEEALSANQNNKPDNPTQRAIDSLLAGKKPDLAGRSLTDLLGLERAIDLCGPVIDIGENVTNRIIAQIERLRLLEPLQRLVADGFAGRKKEMERLRAYVDELPPKSLLERLSRGVGDILDIFRHRPPLIICGPGGVGKSTLLAKFLLDHTGPNQESPIPFIYLDFDRGQLDPLKSDTLLEEAFRQIRLQFPEFAEKAASLESAVGTRILSEDYVNISRSAHYDQSTRLRVEFVELLRDVCAEHDSNLLLFVDTFEMVQRRGPTPVYNVLTFAAELTQALPNLRFVIAGRAALKKDDFSFSKDVPRWKPLQLEGFDLAAGRVYLRNRLKGLGTTNISSLTIDRIVKLVKGNPLSLRLAAQVFTKQSLEAIEDAVGQARFDAEFTQERLQGMLHSRIVQHLPERLRKIADPGLIVRRITPEVIADVLAGPCELELKDRGEANQLFEELSNEVAIVEPFGESMLRHRQDVRVLMLPLLRAKLGELAAKIDKAAVEFWRKNNEPEARAEEIYHLLWMEAERDVLEESWSRGPVSTLSLEEALDEFEALDHSPSTRIWLCTKLGREIPPDLESKVDQLEWERDAEMRARRLLSDGAAKEALKVLRLRKDRTSASSLWLLELEALKLMGEDKRALNLVEKALKAAKDANVPAHIHALLLHKVSLLERSDRFEEALSLAWETDRLSKSLKNALLQFESGLTLARLLRKNARDHESVQLQGELATMLDLGEISMTLSERPALLLEAAAELGSMRPELFILLTDQSETSRVQDQTAMYIDESSDRTLESVNLESTKLFSNESIEALFTDRRDYKRSPRFSAMIANFSIGSAYAARHDFERSLPYLERSLAIAREIDNLEGEEKTLDTLGTIYLHKGNTKRAVELFKRKLKIATMTGNHKSEMGALHRLGIVYFEAKNNEKAIDFLKRSLDIAEKIGDTGGRGYILGNLGITYIKQGELEKSLSLLREALSISEEIGDLKMKSKVLETLGNLHYQSSEFDEAIKLYSEQLRISEDIGDKSSQAYALHNLALAYASSGDKESASNNMRNAVKLFSETNYVMAKKAEAWLQGDTSSPILFLHIDPIKMPLRLFKHLRDSARDEFEKLLKQTL